MSWLLSQISLVGPLLQQDAAQIGLRVCWRLDQLAGGVEAVARRELQQVVPGGALEARLERDAAGGGTALDDDFEVTTAVEDFDEVGLI